MMQCTEHITSSEEIQRKDMSLWSTLRSDDNKVHKDNISMRLELQEETGESTVTGQRI